MRCRGFFYLEVTVWETLIADFVSMVRGVVGHYARRDADVEDMVQETFLRAYTHLPSLKDPARFPGWLRQIAMNVGRSYQKVDCRELVAFDVRGIKPGQKRREPKLKVTFEIDASGRLQCRARELPDRVLEVAGDPEPIVTDEWIT